MLTSSRTTPAALARSRITLMDPRSSPAALRRLWRGLADERRQRELRRGGVDRPRQELTQRFGRVGLPAELDGLLVESIEMAQERRFDQRLLGGEVPEQRRDAAPGPGGDVLGRAERAPCQPNPPTSSVQSP